MQIWTDKIGKLNTLYNNSTESSLIFLKGEMGLGQSYVINGFMEDKDNVIIIKQFFKNDYYLAPLIDAISSINKIDLSDNYLNESEKLRLEIIHLLKQKRNIFIFENINSYNEKLLQYCVELIRYTMSNLKYTNTFIIADVNTDVITDSQSSNNILKELMTLSFEIQYINFKKLSGEILKEIFYNGFHSNINITESDLDYIISSAFGNVSWLTIIVNYLKQEEYIYFSEDNVWECLHIQDNVLDDIIRKNIHKRYEKLDPGLKTVLQKSSLIGPIFHAEQLVQSFELLKVHQELIQIEKISELIHNDHQTISGNRYSFENEDVHRMIHEIVPDDKRCSWNNILAQYFEKISSDIDKNNIEKFQIYRKTAICNAEARKYKKAVIYYLKAIHLGISLLDYSQALSLIHRAKDLLCLIDETSDYFYSLLFSEAKCYQLLGRYGDELEIYNRILGKCNLKEREYYQILFQQARALYNNAQNNSALDLLHKIESKLPQFSDDRFSLDVFRELAAIYYFCRLCDKAGEYYTKALNVCQKGKFERDYYILLRQSSMFWDLEISKKAQLRASDYFTSIKDIKEQAMVSHNLGTDALWSGDKNFSDNYLNLAEDLFAKYGSTDIHYTYNCLGVYQAAYNKDYKSAIFYFEKIKNFKTDLFSQLICIVNCASCYSALGDLNKAEYLLSTYEKQLKKIEEPIPPYFLYYYICKGIFYKLLHKNEKSIVYFRKSLEHKLKNEQLFLVGKHLKDMEMDGTDVNKYISTAQIDSLCKISHMPLYDNFYKQNLCLSTLRFWW